MRVEFQPAVEERHEARAAHLETSDASTRKFRSGPPKVSILFLVTGLAMFLAAYICFQLGFRTAASVLVLVGLGASIGLAIRNSIVTLEARDKTNHPPVEQFVKPIPVYAATAFASETKTHSGMLAVLLVGGVVLLQLPKSAWSATINFAAYGLFVCAFAGLIFSVVSMRRKIIRGMNTAATDPSLCRTQRWTFDDLGVAIDDGQTSEEHRWVSIRRFVETPNLLLLYISQEKYVFVPKRALGSANGVDELRKLLREKVGPMRGFPVLAPP